MAKKTTKKMTAKALTEAVQKLKRGFKVKAASNPSNQRKARAAFDAASGSKRYGVVGSPDLQTIKKKYGLAGGDAVPNGISGKTVKVTKTTKGTNVVFEISSGGAGSDKPSQSKTLIVSKYTGRPVSAQG